MIQAVGWLLVPPGESGPTSPPATWMTAVREARAIKGGGRPFTKQDRSRFLGALDAAIQAIQRTSRQ